MTDLEFLDQAEKLLLAVERSCDRINDEGAADVDSQRTGGMVTLTFPNRSQIIINLQKPLHEVWMAAKSGGYHYRFDGLAWQDTKGAGEFFDRLSRDAEQQSGTPLRFVACLALAGSGAEPALQWQDPDMYCTCGATVKTQQDRILQRISCETGRVCDRVLRVAVAPAVPRSMKGWADFPGLRLQRPRCANIPHRTTHHQHSPPLAAQWPP